MLRYLKDWEDERETFVSKKRGEEGGSIDLPWTGRSSESMSYDEEH